ncbi:MAG: hypothetical protein KBS59_03935 [Clostridiales bacterium]|nr:hypothetical protein [Clostridiales bacterium]
MNENRNTCILPGIPRDTVYIDTDRILDSCRDKDCYENVPVYLCEGDSEIIERAASIRTKEAKVIAASMSVDTVPFNKGFYQISARIFVHIKCEVCGAVGRAQEVDGICFVDKKVILYGSEGNVNIFKSRPGVHDFCSAQNIELASTNLPTAVLEVVDPIVLDAKIGCADVCTMLDFPDIIGGGGERRVVGRNGRALFVSLGFFSIVRIERPGQYLVNGTEYTVPEKECHSPIPDDPCGLFRHMEFPVGQFYPPELSELRLDKDIPSGQGGCGCKH